MTFGDQKQQQSFRIKHQQEINRSRGSETGVQNAMQPQHMLCFKGAFHQSNASTSTSVYWGTPPILHIKVCLQFLGRTTAHVQTKYCIKPCVAPEGGSEESDKLPSSDATSLVWAAEN